MKSLAQYVSEHIYISRTCTAQLYTTCHSTACPHSAQTIFNHLPILRLDNPTLVHAVQLLRHILDSNEKSFVLSRISVSIRFRDCQPDLQPDRQALRCIVPRANLPKLTGACAERTMEAPLLACSSGASFPRGIMCSYCKNQNAVRSSFTLDPSFWITHTAASSTFVSGLQTCNGKGHFTMRQRSGVST